MKTKIQITFIALALISSSACSIKFLDDEANDTQIGDDDGLDDVGETDDGEGGLPDIIEEHGFEAYCVDRVLLHAAMTPSILDDIRADEVKDYEWWYQPETRGYEGYLDLSDKPSPMWWPGMCSPEGGPGESKPEQGESCMNAFYHMMLPIPQLGETAPPGFGGLPYSKNIITETIGNPPASGRMTGGGIACCLGIPTEVEVEKYGIWFDDFANPNTVNFDCQYDIAQKGVHMAAGGYIFPSEKHVALGNALRGTQCIGNPSWGYSPAGHAEAAISKVGSATNQPGQYILSWPAILNYDWVEDMNLINWGDFEVGALTDLQNAVIQGIIGALYLPPDDFLQPRYGAGGACHHPVMLKYNQPLAGGWYASMTCPYGYFEDLPDFYKTDLETQISGVIGHCVLDGYGGGTGLVESGDILPATPLDNSGRHFITDVEAFFEGLAFFASVHNGEPLEITAADEALFAELGLVDPESGDPLLRAGDTIEWWSTKSEGLELPIAEAFRHTVSFTVDELAAQTGLSQERAEELVMDLGVGKLADWQQNQAWADTLDGIDAQLGQVRSNELRPGTWRIRVVSPDGLTRFFTFVGA